MLRAEGARDALEAQVVLLARAELDERVRQLRAVELALSDSIRAQNGPFVAFGNIVPSTFGVFLALTS